MNKSLKLINKRLSLGSTQETFQENTLKIINDDNNEKLSKICRICLC